ncbi:hypothetical protein C8J56DRAFT_172872 [Mycena floridula]|nr:hypothetical protein C8J56DRAFT_172872 [Mycena floridula]
MDAFPVPNINQVFPIEIITKIFVFVVRLQLGGEHESTRYSPASRNLAPLLLCNVCSAWNKLATSLPSLWSSIYITRRSWRVLPSLEAVHLFLKNSGNHPLYIRIDDEISQDQELDIILTLLVQHAARWEQVYLDIPHYATPLALADISDIGTPKLDSFYLDTRHDATFIDDNGITPNPSQNDFTVAALSKIMSTSISLREIDYSGNSSWVPSTSTSLMEVRLCTAGVSVRDLGTLLHGCPLLEHLWVFPVMNSNELFIPPHIVHNSLHSLHLNTVTVVDRFLESLTLPSLGQLSVTAFGAPTQVCGMTVLRNLISRSNCTLDLLSLSFFNVGTADLISLLGMTPSLERLGLHEVRGGISPVDDELLLRLTAGTPGYLCPKMYRFECEIEQGNSTDGILSAMAASRRLTESNPDFYDGLDVIEIQAGSRWCQRHPEDLRGLKELSISKGLRVIGSVFNAELAHLFTWD